MRSLAKEQLHSENVRDCLRAFVSCAWFTVVAMGCVFIDSFRRHFLSTCHGLSTSDIRRKRAICSLEPSIPSPSSLGPFVHLLLTHPSGLFPPSWVPITPCALPFMALIPLKWVVLSFFMVLFCFDN